MQSASCSLQFCSTHGPEIQDKTRLDTKNPYPFPDLLYLELYHYVFLMENHQFLSTTLHNDFLLFREAAFPSKF